MARLRLHLRHRRILACLVTFIAIVACQYAVRLETNRLGSPSWVSGITLLSCLILLMALGIRRRLPFWPLGNVSTWTQVHLYVGIFAAAVYLMHVPVLVAGGLFESVLSVLFLTVTGSGFYGIYASRTLPKKLSAVEGEPRFDRTPWHREQIADAAKRIIESVSESKAGRVLESFYADSLSPYFACKPSLAYVLAPGGARRRQLLGDLKELDRYLESEGRRAAGQFAALVRRRDDLDYQYALQLRLRSWVVIHSLLSSLLVAASVVHVALVVRFAG